jgi:very-short-patch-repair endonuclease
VGGGAVSEAEAQAVAREVVRLASGAFAGTVAVVTPFRAQAVRIRHLLSKRLDLETTERLDLLIDTAHGLQGDERDVVIFSPCIGARTPRGARHFLEAHPHLFNVAITRARAVLHVMGDLHGCQTSGIPHVERFTAYVADITRRRGVQGPGAQVLTDPTVGAWEEALYQALVRAGVTPLRQHKVGPYRLDFAVESAGDRLAIEVDGAEFHTAPDGQPSPTDRRRDTWLEGHGWTVLRFAAARVRDDAEGCAAEIVGALASRGGQT